MKLLLFAIIALTLAISLGAFAGNCVKNKMDQRDAKIRARIESIQ